MIFFMVNTKYTHIYLKLVIKQDITNLNDFITHNLYKNIQEHVTSRYPAKGWYRCRYISEENITHLCKKHISIQL